MTPNKKKLDFLQINIQVENDESHEWQNPCCDQSVPVGTKSEKKKKIKDLLSNQTSDIGKIRFFLSGKNER